MSGGRQNIWAVSATIGYNIMSKSTDHKLMTKLEYRYDRSTGPESGYFRGHDNHLAPDQNVLFLSLVWRFNPR